MNRNDFEIEICAGNIQSVIAADKAGADRVELCDNLVEGGTTPSIGTIAVAKDISTMDVFPIIRPRGGNFVYDEVEIKIMIQDIKQAMIAGADGVVIGALNSDGSINVDQCSRMIEAAKGLPVTFHRAFDQCSDPFKALERIMSMGISRLLTSGHRNKAIDGVKLIKQLQDIADDRLIIMPGGGIDENNITELAEISGVQAFHASLRDFYLQKDCFWRDEVKFNGFEGLSEKQIKSSNVERIINVIKKIKGYDF